MKKISLVLLSSFMALYAHSQTISTFVGDGTSGYIDGSGTAARLNQPNGMAIDKSGNIYVADLQGNRIRKITPAGVVSTFAGTGIAGLKDGPASSAQFFNPWGLALDTAGNLFVADTKNQAIRKITPAGIVSTYAGSGTAGFADGPAATAEFSYPCNVIADEKGNIYVCDFDNDRIRMINSSGMVSTFAGSGVGGLVNGPAATAEFDGPQNMILTKSGDMFVTDLINHVVRKIDKSGNVSTFAGDGSDGYADGPGATAKFRGPSGIDIDKYNNLYITDTYDWRIRKIDQAGVVSTVAGAGTSGYTDGAAASATFKRPQDLVIDRLSGNIYITDEFNHCIRVLKGLITSVKEAPSFGEVNVFPNPADRTVHISCPALNKAEVHVAIYNYTGQKVAHYRPLISGQQLEMDIDVSELPSGCYFLRIDQANAVYTSTFIK